LGSYNEAEGTRLSRYDFGLCILCLALPLPPRTLNMLIIMLQDGLRITYFWIKEQIEKEKSQGMDLSIYGSSKVVGTQAPVQLGSLRAADGKE